MTRHTVTSDEIIRAEQAQEITLASSSKGAKKLVWYPYTQTYAVLLPNLNGLHTMDRSVAIEHYNDLP